MAQSSGISVLFEIPTCENYNPFVGSSDSALYKTNNSMICTWYLALLPLVIFQNCLKIHSLNGSWNYVKQFSNITCGLLCQISLQIMLLPIQILKCCKPSCNLAINILVNFCGGFFKLARNFLPHEVKQIQKLEKFLLCVFCCCCCCCFLIDLFIDTAAILN